MATHRAAVVAAAAAALVFLSGCTTAHRVSAPTPASTGDPTVNVEGFTAAPSPLATAESSADQSETKVAPTSAAPGSLIPSGDTITPTLAASAETTAAAFLQAFVRKDLTGQAWENGYLDFLTPYSQTAYEGTGQRGVPGSQVTGSPALAEDGTNTTTSAVITVPTDAGVFRVQVLITNAGTWLVQRAVLPGAEE